MIALLAALVVTAVAGGSDDAVVARLHVRIDARDVRVSSCRDVIDEPEAGLATIGFRFQVSDARASANGGRYTGTVVFDLGEIVVLVPKSISWPEMSDADRARVEALRRAIFHHEIGHVRVAEAVRESLNAARTPIVAPDVFAFRAQADDVGRTGFERFKREELEYDELTDHGRRQQNAPGALGGPNTALHCDTPG